jgi:hypothetical protein
MVLQDQEPMVSAMWVDDMRSRARARWADVMAEPSIGDVIEVGDRDYKFGAGPLILRVTRVGDRMLAADGEWLDLEGFELRVDGSQLAPHPRQAAVRLSAICVRRGL